MNQLFTPIKIGRNTLRNRLVMSPMTRSRADDTTGVPAESTALYYAQRADAGLIVTEGHVSFTDGQRLCAHAGHPQRCAGAGMEGRDRGRACQGRDHLPATDAHRAHFASEHAAGGALPVAPSAIQPKGTVFTATGPQELVTPRALATGEIAQVIDEYRLATRRALEAGFDGVELHAASGYLPEQFLSSEPTNARIVTEARWKTARASSSRCSGQ